MIFLTRNSFIREFLSETEIFTESDAVSLSEDAKDATLSSLAVSTLNDLAAKVGQINGSLDIDRSRGDIRSFPDLQYLQNAVTKLETIVEGAANSHEVEKVKDYIKAIIRTIMYLNQYRDVFKTAYASKKTVLMLKYKELIMAIETSIAYLISAIVDFSSGYPSLKSIFSIDEIAPIKALEQFNNQVDSGHFKTMVHDTIQMREAYSEVPVEELYNITEASDIVSTITNGLSNFSKNITQGGKAYGMLYKAIGIIVLLISMREVFYTLYRTRHEYSDVADAVKQFAAFDTNKISDKFKKFVNTFAADVETASSSANREIVDGNRDLAKAVKEMPAIGIIPSAPSSETSSVGDFSFGF